VRKPLSNFKLVESCCVFEGRGAEPCPGKRQRKAKAFIFGDVIGGPWTKVGEGGGGRSKVLN
jgi:hypothetical protein